MNTCCTDCYSKSNREQNATVKEGTRNLPSHYPNKIAKTMSLKVHSKTKTLPRITKH